LKYPVLKNILLDENSDIKDPESWKILIAAITKDFGFTIENLSLKYCEIKGFSAEKIILGLSQHKV